MDLSLDESISSHRVRGGRRGGRGGGAGPMRRGAPNRDRQKAELLPYRKNTAFGDETSWTHDLFEGAGSGAPVGKPMRSGPKYASTSNRSVRSIELGTPVVVSNLDFSVADEDLKEIFSEVGDLRKATVSYDRSGRSEGTARVVFARRADAQTAVKKFNGVEVEGRAIRLYIDDSSKANFDDGDSGNGVIKTTSGGIVVTAGGNQRTVTARSGGGARGGRGRGRGNSSNDGGFVPSFAPRGRGGRGRGARGGRGGRGGRGRGPPPSADQLDSELDAYMQD